MTSTSIRARRRCLPEGLAAGCAGVISGSTNVSAALAHQVLRTSGAERDALQAKLTDFRQTIQKFPLIPAVKQVHAWRTNDAGWLRMLPPLRGLSAEQTRGAEERDAAVGTDRRGPRRCLRRKR